MSRINRVRIINLKYNHDAIQIGDETFDLNGENTLLSLRNGGGKTVLVQMMIAPFVHKRYRDLKDRAFSSYFNTSKPSFILVEWKLDGGGGYVLTGMMVRRNQDTDSPFDLDTIGFITEYDGESNLDIAHIPLAEKTSKGEVVKGYIQSRQLFDTWKKDSGVDFFYYDLNQSTQSKQYFSKLEEYDIFYREWEAIIHKINLEESGLSNLFSDCKNEEGLVEKWLLDTIEKKHNRTNDSMKEFRVLTAKYVRSYKDNQSKIQKKEAIEVFKQETEGVKSLDEEYFNAEGEMDAKKNEIAAFRDTLSELLSDKNQEISSLEDDRDKRNDDVRYLNHQKYSSDIYATEDEIEENQIKHDELNADYEDIEKERQETEKNHNLYICAGQQDDLNEIVRDLRNTEERLNIQREKNKDLKPEREKIGSRLSKYFGDKLDDVKHRTAHIEQDIKKTEEEISGYKKELSEKEALKQQAAIELGALNQKISAFDDAEDRFNDRYKTGFTRNILGVYEEGLLTDAKLSGEERLKEAEQKKKDIIKEKDSAKKELDLLSHRLDEEKKHHTLTESSLSHKREEKQELDRQLEERRSIIKYFDIPEENILNTEEILKSADTKLKANEEVRKAMEISLVVTKRELRQLNGEESIELSDDFKRMLENSGIDFVYGMEWLIKNSNTESQNKMLVKRFPFLPYSLIISRHDAEHLTKITDAANTSIPVPLIIREDMNAGEEEKKKPADQNLISFEGVSFYISFNRELLNRKKLKELVEKKQYDIEKVKDQIASREQEYHTYYDKRGVIANQTVNADTFSRIQTEISGLEEELKQSLETIEGFKKQQASLTEKINEASARENKAEEQIRHCGDFLKDLESFSGSYNRYLRVRDEQSSLEKSFKKIQERIKQLGDLSDQAALDLRKADALKSQLTQQAVELTREVSKYSQYKASDDSVAEEEAAELIARYEAITAKSAVEEKELEDRIAEQTNRMNRKLRELNNSASEYGFLHEEWKDVVYEQEAVMRLEKESKALLDQMKAKQKEITAVDRKAGKLEEREKTLYANMKEATGMDEALPKSEIPVMNFDEAIVAKKHEIRNIENLIKEAVNRSHVYEENLAAMAEFEDFSRDGDTQLMDDISDLSSEQIRNRQGKLRRDFQRLKERLQKYKSDLDRMIAAVMRSEKLADDFFQKPLNTLLSLTASADQLLKQLEIILSSFDQLIEKLMVDISFVDKEENELIELVSEYMQSVNTDLGKIDDNSTINIRQRPVKMLKISVPDWEENEALYLSRLKGYFDEVTKHCIDLLEENKNIEEYLGAKISTKALYDAVIGISNVSIHLYKIEAEREYPITWSDVAKNSGGEGFLSAFVILTSLLYYLRRNDSDVFSDRKESKVLIMDNPFAQTNASHLLIPLMDFAKKTNTQLICLSGLGGESIYNRFDNIYVLNLFSSSLRSGLQYLKAEHERGSDAESMMVSNIHVQDMGDGEQMKLF